jgi:hypothetical protein
VGSSGKRGDELKPLFDEKCRVRGVQPDIAGLTSETLREWNQNAWLNRLGPMLKDVPDFDLVWDEWVKTFHDQYLESENLC